MRNSWRKMANHSVPTLECPTIRIEGKGLESGVCEKADDTHVVQSPLTVQ